MNARAWSRSAPAETSWLSVPARAQLAPSPRSQAAAHAAKLAHVLAGGGGALGSSSAGQHPSSSSTLHSGLQDVRLPGPLAALPPLPGPPNPMTTANRIAAV